jgi:hypothetical protein
MRKKPSCNSLLSIAILLQLQRRTAVIPLMIAANITYVTIRCACFAIHHATKKKDADNKPAAVNRRLAIPRPPDTMTAELIHEGATDRSNSFIRSQ